MKIARLAGLAFAAGVAVGLAAASMAVAEPEFKPATATVTATSGTTVLEAGVVKVTCEKSSFTGNIASLTLIGHVIIHYLGCTSSGEGGSRCTIKSNSVGASEGLIVTNTLHAVLGLSLPKVGTGVGLLFLPAFSNGVVVSLAGNACTEETGVVGNVAGEVSPIGVSLRGDSIKFVVSSGKQAIRGFDLSTGGSLTAKLTAFLSEAVVSATDSVSYSTATEVS